MAFPILEGVQLLHAARGLLHELRGIGHGAKANPTTKAATVSSSDFASLLKAASSDSATSGSTAAAAAASGDRFTNLPPNLAARLEEEIAQFRAELGNLFNQLPIDQMPELVLTSDASGNVVVANDHPDKDRIEALFKAHPALADAFQRLSVNASIVRTAAVAFPFGLGYLKDPQGSVMQLGESLSGANSPRNFQLTIGPNGVFTSFADTSGSGTSDGQTTT